MPEPKSVDQTMLNLFAHGAAAFQYLRAGVVVGLFDLLDRRPGSSTSDVCVELGLHNRSATCLLYGLRALGVIQPVADGFENGPAISQLFERGEWEMYSALLEFQAQIVYPGQEKLLESVRQNRNVGVGQIPGVGTTLYERLAQNDDLSTVFYNYMTKWSEYANPQLLKHVSFESSRSIIDVGGGSGVNALAVAARYPRLNVTIFDLPSVRPLAERSIDEASMSRRVSFASGDFFEDPFPQGHDCFLFAHQLVIWSEERNRILLRKAYDSLPKGGRVVVFSSMSNDELSGPLMAALDSAYFLSVAAGQSMIYRYVDYESWLRDVGFSVVERIECDGWSPHGIVTAEK